MSVCDMNVHKYKWMQLYTHLPTSFYQATIYTFTQNYVINLKTKFNAYTNTLCRGMHNIAMR